MTAAVPRPRRALDARLVIGVGLVLASVAGVVALVGAADRRTEVYAVAAAVAPGERVAAADLVTRRVALDGADDLYVAPGQLPDEGLVATQALRAGELLAVSAVGSAQALDSTSLVLDLVVPVAASTPPGAAIDLWAVRAAEAGYAPDAAPPAPPSVLVADAVLVGPVESDALVAGQQGARVEVLIPRSRVALVLQAIASGSSLAAVPAGLPWAPR